MPTILNETRLITTTILFLWPQAAAVQPKNQSRSPGIVNSHNIS
jgi:hypothetical protein